eukprot:766535-Hanusia_phi.AAC.4
MNGAGPGMVLAWRDHRTVAVMRPRAAAGMQRRAPGEVFGGAARQDDDSAGGHCQLGSDGRAAFAELGFASIAVSFCSSLVAETVRVLSYCTVPELPAASD